MIDELQREHLSRPERLGVQKLLMAAPWLWPAQGDDDALARARRIADAPPPALVPGQMPLLTVNDGSAAIWMLGGAAAPTPGIPAAARIGPKAADAWVAAKRAAGNVLPGPGAALDAVAAEPASAMHLYAIATKPDSVFVLERVIDGASFGLSFFLSMSSLLLKTPVMPDLVASAEVDAAGHVSGVDAIGSKLLVVWRCAPRLTRFLVARAQIGAAVDAARATIPDATVEPLDDGMVRLTGAGAGQAVRRLDLIPVDSVKDALALAFGERWARQARGVWLRGTREIVRRHRMPIAVALVLLLGATAFFVNAYRRHVRESEAALLNDNVRVILESADSSQGRDDLRSRWTGEDGRRWRAQAERGMPGAQFLVAIALLTFEARTNPEAAARAAGLVEAAAQQDFMPAVTQLGVMVRDGIRIQRDVARGNRLLEASAARGDRLAMHHLAVSYDRCLGVKCDAARAYELDRAAAELGLVFALTDTGQREFVGRGTVQNQRQACERYRLAAEQGDDVGRRGYNVCRQAQIVNGDPDVPVRALSDHQSACEKGRTDSCVLAGRLNNVAGDLAAAARWYRAGCGLDYVLACVELASLAIDHAEVVPDIDEMQARASFEKGCADGLRDACVNLAMLEFQARSGLANRPRAYALLQDYCRKGDVRSCYLVAVTEWQTEPARRGLIAARYQTLCDQGLIDACEAWGQALDGTVTAVKRDDTEARKAFELACYAGRHSACRELASLLAEGRGGSVDKGLARQLYERACRASDPVGCLAWMRLLALDSRPAARQQSAEAMAILRQWCRYHPLQTCRELFGDGSH